MEIKPDFAFTPIPRSQDRCASLLGAGQNSTWLVREVERNLDGQGFNFIWRPFQGGPPNQDRFLELNLTEETLRFEEIPGAIPNRGLLQPDINMFGLWYLQTISDANIKDAQGKPAGLHLEPGFRHHDAVEGIVRAYDATELDPTPIDPTTPRLKLLWDSRRTGVTFNYSKFYPPVVADSRLFVTTYDGRADVYMLPP
jgi:hypothetical protein